jgi:hypothetical protein
MLASGLKWSIFEVDVPGLHILRGRISSGLLKYSPINIGQEYVEVNTIPLQCDSISVHRQLIFRHVHNPWTECLQDSYES